MVDRASRCFLSIDVLETRTFDAMQPLLNQASGADRYFSDGLETYQTLLYQSGEHQAVEDKSQTYSVEANNADLRHYLARLQRNSRCFSRCLNALRRALWLFAYAYNQRQLKQRKNPTYNFSLIECLPTLS